MNVLETIFWIFVSLVFYTYLGYGFTLCLLVIFKRKLTRKQPAEFSFLPGVSIIVAAYNEKSIIEQKIRNTLAIDYPPDKLSIIFVTDGSTDGSMEIVRKYSNIKLLHEGERKGKIAAVQRAMAYVKSDIVVFTDANTLLNESSIKNLVRHFGDGKVGAVAGEKRILVQDKDQASAAGEGIYWKYESRLKGWDSEFNTVVGAAGELFAIRTELYEDLPADTLIEDFYLTLRIAQKGYRVVYEPEAFAMEEPALSTKEELKRKIRIAAGGIQSILRLMPLLNIFMYGWLSFQYFSHRVLRWTLAPLALPVIFVLNLILAFESGIFYWFFILQVAFYLFAFSGFLLEMRKTRLKLLFIPYYFCLMNYAVYAGMWRLMTGKQSVLWEKAKRRDDLV